MKRQKGDDIVATLFEDLKQGLEEAIDYEKGTQEAKIKTMVIHPVKNYSNKEIRKIRMNSGMTQAVFASYMGVSVKTVEAWENGRTHPTGPAFRLLEVLDKSKGDIDYVIFDE